MKTIAFASVLAILLLPGMFLFSSCEQTAPADLSTPIGIRSTAPDVPEILQVPAGYQVSYHTYAEGVQIYECMETAPGEFAWVFIAPSATLYANENFNGVVGSHYGGPTWESNSGSWVKAAKLQGLTVEPTAVPWLLLGTTASQGPGIFWNTTHIQRINTTGGLAPADPAHAGNVGERVEVPYTAEYYFYKVQ